MRGQHLQMPAWPLQSIGKDQRRAASGRRLSHTAALSVFAPVSGLPTKILYRERCMAENTC